MMKSGALAALCVLIAHSIAGCVVETSSAQPATTPAQAVSAVSTAVGATHASPGTVASSAAASPTPQEVTITAGLESATVLRGSSGEAFLVVDLCAASAPMIATRPGMAVALVVDRSGSMAGDKIVNARAAASALVQGMADGDVVALYAYDDVVEQLAPPTVLTAASRVGLLMAIQTLYARGSTNLYGGLVAGIDALSRAAAERPVRRVVMISDGNANVGPSSPFEIGQAASAAAAGGITATAIGVGLDYNEAVLDAVAIRSGGRFYHLTEPAQLAGILQIELDTLSATVARSVVLELEPLPGVQVLGASGAHLTRRGHTTLLTVGDLVGGQSRQVVVPLMVPTTGADTQQAARITLAYRGASSDDVRSVSTPVGYGLTTSPTQVAADVRPELAAAVEQYRTTQAQLEAARLVGQGRNDRAADVLEAQAAASERRARSFRGSAAAKVRANVGQLRSRGGLVRGARGRASRAQQLEINQEAMAGQGYR